MAKKIVIASGDSDPNRAYPVLIMASAAASAGVDVTLFYTMKGLEALKKDGAKKIEMPGAPPFEDLMKQCVDLGVKFTACSLALSVMGIKKEELVDFATPVGVATCIQEMLEADKALYI